MSPLTGAEEIAAAALPPEDSTSNDDDLPDASPSQDGDSGSGSDSDTSDSSSDSDSDSDSGASDDSDLPAPKSRSRAKKAANKKKSSAAASAKPAGKENATPSMHKGKKISSAKPAGKENAIPSAHKGKRISNYEQEREENIAQNRVLLEQILTSDPDGLAAVGLGVENGRLVHANSASPSATLAKRKRKRKDSAAASITLPRKSARLGGGESMPDSGAVGDVEMEDPFDGDDVATRGSPAPRPGDSISTPGPLTAITTSSPGTPIGHQSAPVDPPSLHDDSSPTHASTAIVTDSRASPTNSFATATQTGDDILHRQETAAVSIADTNTAMNLEPSADVPDWLRKPLAEIAKISLGAKYNTLLGLLCQLERAYQFHNKTRGYPKNRRPQLLNDWVTDGRGRSSTPVVSNVAVFAERWWVWWSTLQPSWRGSGRPFTRLENQSEWGLLVAPGANGMLGVVACLYWWGKSVLKEVDEGLVQVAGGVDDWQDAVAEVHWVLQALIDTR